MKKILTKILSGLIISALFTSCFDPVFYNINRDVPPTDKSVMGYINSIARFTVADKEYIVVAANGGLRYKLAEKNDKRDKYIMTVGDHDLFTSTSIFGKENVATSWLTYSLPKEVYSPHYYDYYGDSGTTGHVGQQIIKVLADKDTLYLVTADYEDSNEGTSGPSAIHLWALKLSSILEDGETWGELDSYIDLNTDKQLSIYIDDSSYYKSAFNVFGTNSVKPENRFVFLRQDTGDDHKTSKLYKLSGTSLEEYAIDLNIDDIGDVEKKDELEIDKLKINSVVFFKNNFIFFETQASITNETKDKEADVVYYGKDTTIYYKKSDSEFKAVEDKSNNNISCLAMTSDYLLIGCANYDTTYTSNGGILHSKLADGIPTSITSDFKTNLTVQIPSSYFIFTLLNTDPSKTELDSSLYTSVGFVTSGSTSSVSYSSLCLWSYFPERGNWNRE